MNAFTRLALRSGLPAAIVAAAGVVTPVSAQNLGTFGFTLQPFCNVVTLTVIVEGGTYRLYGSDDACGANERLPARGRIAPNQDGTLHVAFTVTRPNGIAVETSIRNFAVGPYTGNWTDSAGNSGTSGLLGLSGTPGASGARPGPSSALLPNSVSTGTIVDGAVTAAKILDGTVGLAEVNAAEVQLRVAGTCPSGQAVASVNQNGSVNCVSTGGSTASFTESAENMSGGALSTTCQAVASLPITIPAAGKLSCTAVQHAVINHTNAPTDPSRLTAEIETTAASCPDGLLAGNYEIPAGIANYIGQNVSVPVLRRFDVTAGSVTVHLNTRLWNLTTGSQLGNALSCTFTPQ